MNSGCISGFLKSHMELFHSLELDFLFLCLDILARILFSFFFNLGHFYEVNFVCVYVYSKRNNKLAASQTYVVSFFVGLTKVLIFKNIKMLNLCLCYRGGHFLLFDHRFTFVFYHFIFCIICCVCHGRLFLRSCFNR